MLWALSCLISVNPREHSAYLRMECNFFTCFLELVLPPCIKILVSYQSHPHVPFLPAPRVAQVKGYVECFSGWPWWYGWRDAARWWSGGRNSTQRGSGSETSIVAVSIEGSDTKLWSVWDFKINSISVILQQISKFRRVHYLYSLTN